MPAQRQRTAEEFVFPSGRRFTAWLEDVAPWAPEGWIGRLPDAVMPTHYFVRSLRSSSKYQLDMKTGKGFGHQEMNYGRRFPQAFVWVQGTADGGRSQLLLTGGRFTISGITSQHYILTYRSRERSWDFRSIDLHRFRSEVDGCNGTLLLTALSGHRRLELRVSAPAESASVGSGFSEQIYVPTTDGFSREPGSSESHTALAVVRLYAARSEPFTGHSRWWLWVSWDGGAADGCHGGAESIVWLWGGVSPSRDRRKGLRPIEYAIFRQAALERNGEFGGEYNCASSAPTATASTAATAFVGPARPSPLRRSKAKLKKINNPDISRDVSSLRHGHAAPMMTLAATTTTPRPASASLLAPTAAALVAAAAAFSVRKARRKRSLQEGIADFYDASTGKAMVDESVWVEIWGDHLHHGYYEDNSWRSLKQHQEAQVRMIEEVLSWAKVDGLSSVSTVLDVGCGVGGSSRYLQKKYGAKVTGITLSPKQCAQAQELSRKTGQEERCDFQVADALKMPFADDSFDLIWSLESGEHMPRKAEFMAEMHRAPWQRGPVAQGETFPMPDVRPTRPGRHATLGGIADYRQIAQEQLGMTGLRTDDWSQYIAPFWSAVIRSALQPRGWWALLRGGLETFRGALVMPLMNRGYRTGTIRFALLTGLKTGGATGSAPGEEYIHLEVMVLLMRLV
ncbi:Probable tocopherol O-methyltransferase [Durusdinium trenchii]|uniref:Chloroplastic (Gamma-tocopherol methyltransferase) (Vitamin E pathway gene 4 protein) n=1 Tax=Durusdinium trenchii TaxID=1381693 RepID=A0ABP0NY32_9DINO